MNIFDTVEDMEVSYKPHCVYRVGGKKKTSWAITIPKPFAEAMKINHDRSYVIIRLVKEDVDHHKKAYLVVEKLQ